MSISISIKLFKSLLLFVAMFASWQSPFVLADPSELTTNRYTQPVPAIFVRFTTITTMKRGKYKLSMGMYATLQMPNPLPVTKSGQGIMMVNGQH